MAARYKPSKGDIAFRDLTDGDDDNPFEVAIALRLVSDEYLSVLMSDSQRESSRPFLRQIEFEVQRRSADQSRAANFIAAGALTVAALSIIASVIFG